MEFNTLILIYSWYVVMYDLQELAMHCRPNSCMHITEIGFILDRQLRFL